MPVSLTSSAGLGLDLKNGQPAVKYSTCFPCHPAIEWCQVRLRDHQLEALCVQHWSLGILLLVLKLTSCTAQRFGVLQKLAACRQLSTCFCMSSCDQSVSGDAQKWSGVTSLCASIRGMGIRSQFALPMVPSQVCPASASNKCWESSMHIFDECNNQEMGHGSEGQRWQTCGHLSTAQKAAHRLEQSDSKAPNFQENQ